MLGICCILYLCWFTNHFVAYATIFNATNFGSNLYLNMTVFTTASFGKSKLLSSIKVNDFSNPFFFLVNSGANTMLYLIIERLNRRTLSRIAYTFMIVCCACLALSFYVEEQEKAAFKISLQTNASFVDSRIDPLENRNEHELANQTSSHQDQLDEIYRKFQIDLRNISSAAIQAAKPKKEGSLRIWLGMILKYATSTCYHTIYVLSVESFPTIIRQLSVGTCSVASRFASVIAPFTKELVSFDLIEIKFL